MMTRYVTFSLYCSSVARRLIVSFLFFFNDTATTEIYTLSLHDALPISRGSGGAGEARQGAQRAVGKRGAVGLEDRKSTRLNSSHLVISYAVFCLKKKKNEALGSDHLAETAPTVTQPQHS